MKKNIYYLLAGIFLLLNGSACSDAFLDEKSETDFTSSTLFETTEGLEKMVTALYAYERGFFDINGGQYLANFIYGEKITDLVVFMTGDDARISRYSSPGPSSDATNVVYTPYWERRYYEIGRTNEIIHYGGLLGEEAEAIVAEASFFRAYNYYGLWSKFSRLYLTTEPVTKDNLNSFTYTPADSAAVFKLMYDDLDRAIASLSVEIPAEGRISKATARHMKALVAAWAKDWQEVANQVDAIASEPNGLSLVPDPANIFNKSNLSSSETLWKLNFSMERGGGRGHRFGSQAVNQMANEEYTWTGGVQYNIENLGKNDGRSFPNSYLMSLYPENDKRLSAYYKRFYTYQNPNRLITIPVANDKTVDGVTLRTTTNESGTPYTVQIGDIIYGRDVKNATGKTIDRRRILPSCIKYADIWTKPLDDNGNTSSYKDIMIFRLAESYLLGAEAYMHLGNQVKARDYYNKTWVRAGNPAETGNITFAMIRDEQARELAFEGRRWEFLKRNGIWFKQMWSYAGDFTKYPGSKSQFDKNTYGKTDGRDPAFGPNPNYYYDFNGNDSDIEVRFNVRPHYVNWPIPQSQIDAMGPENFPQNPGYAD
jgi:hypothetical protein